MYTRFLAQYNEMKSGLGAHTFNDSRSYWLVLGLLNLGYFIFSTVKFTLIYSYVLFSNSSIHENMIHGLVRSPSSYFDITPTGQLTNKFSNDLGIMDNMIAWVLTDAMEGPIVSTIFAVNIFTINVYFLIPGIANLIFIVLFFTYCKSPIVTIKQLDLRLKTPVYNMVGEMINGLIPIRIYNRREELLNIFGRKIN
jgi:ABC-type multidrug transport system fused ATPase/permease subunit